MIIFFQELIMLLFLWLLKLIDGIMEIFSSLSGIAKVNYNGKQVNIIELVIGDGTIATVFWCIFILAVGLTCIFAIVSLIKNMVANSKQVSTIVGKFFLSLLGTMAILAVVILGILISNALLTLVSEIFQISNTTKLSSALFNACVGDWLNGYSVAEFDVSRLSVGDIFGSYNTTFMVFPTSWKGNGMVDPNTFLYLPAMIASIGLGIALLVACLNLAKRVYEIVFMYLVMPLSMSTLSLDDGARFKVWRETFITKIVLAYGTVFSVNIFILILPIISLISLSNVSAFGSSMFLIFMIVGGAMVIPAGQMLFAKLFGSSDDAHGSGGFLRTAFYGSRMASMATMHMAAGMIKGTFRTGKKIAQRSHKKDGGEKYSDEKADTKADTSSETNNANNDTGGEE